MATYRTYDLAHADELVRVRSQVRLLLNDVAEPWVFDDDEIQTFLDLEGGVVKLAAAQAIDTNADDQLLASKVLRTQDISTDGAKLADSLRKRAAELRAQATAESEGDGFFELVPGVGSGCAPELTEQRTGCAPFFGWP